MNWTKTINQVAPFVVRIETPRVHGTGFLLPLTTHLPMHCIATARHVIEHVSKWGDPVRIYRSGEKKSFLYKPGEYLVFFANGEKDLAVLLVPQRELLFQDNPPDLIPRNHYLPAGFDVGWLGYPFSADFGLNFFSGRISGNLGTFGEHDHAYLVDGVAISGVSGGPLIVIGEDFGARVAGLITAYHPNRATGEVLPGLAVAQDSSTLHDAIHTAENLELFANPETAPAEPMFDQ